MSTPPLLVELACPRCGVTHWEVDCVFRGAHFHGQRELTWSERTYTCPQCHQDGSGYTRGQISPPLMHWTDHLISDERFQELVGLRRMHFPDRFGEDYIDALTQERTQNLARVRAQIELRAEEKKEQIKRAQTDAANTGRRRVMGWVTWWWR